MEPQRDRAYLDLQHGRRHYTSSSYAPLIRSPCSDSYKSGCSSGGWMTSDYSISSASRTDTSRETGRGDPPFAEESFHQIGRRTPYNNSTYEKTRHRSSNSSLSSSSISVERIQAKLKILEKSNTVMQMQAQNLIAENEVFKKQLKAGTAMTEELRLRTVTLQDELRQEKERHAEQLSKQEEEFRREKERLEEDLTRKKNNNVVLKEEKSTSPLDVETTTCGVQFWSLCKGCEKKLESCEDEGSIVTISKSELEVLEKDMEALRDAVMAREDAWDKAVEREQSYRQQLARLSAETMTARHISEQREDELQSVTSKLMEKETDLKTTQKESLHLRKIVAKLYRCQQRECEESGSAGQYGELTDKDQKSIDEIIRSASGCKGKSKSKPRSARLEKVLNAKDQQANRSPRKEL